MSYEVGLSLPGIKRNERRSRNSYLEKKLYLRESLLSHMPSGGAVYMAYAGECKVGAVYQGRRIYAADIEGSLFHGVEIPVESWVEADCDFSFPFEDLDITWQIGDFDHFNLPYAALRHFLSSRLAERIMLVFTDTPFSRFVIHKKIILPSGQSVRFADRPFAPYRRKCNYVPAIMLPNLMTMLWEYRLVAWEQVRIRNTVLWGCVLQRRMMV